MTESQIDAIILTLEQALGSGQASVTFQGRHMVYKSNEEILKGISYFKGLKVQATGTTRRRQIRLSSSKGLD